MQMYFSSDIEIGEIIIDAIMIVLGIVFFYLAYRNETEEKKKFEEFQVSSLAKSPLRDVWIWVCLNILGQIFNEV
jgi:multisubunit Na+/H+ antiporter MnhB subunit